ncbi:MAG: NAD(P)-dependent oxidoreductase [Chloroflexota bacterium]|jgi:nucleoside-diphosphate-sugar epimerase|nr:MAG: NAD(P)-dependent oxidoreductase [Chloroflexota bacterium]
MHKVEEEKHVLITGGAGYLGSLACSHLLQLGYRVTVVDDLLYGGESLLAYLSHPEFNFVKANVCEARTIRSAINQNLPVPVAIMHLAGIVGFPACQAVGRHVAWQYNVEAAQRAFEQAEELGVERFIFASTYSNYGTSSQDDLATEESSVNPQSLYAETMVAVEKFLQAQAGSNCAPLIFRMAHLYGLSPRPRFDLLVNQFILEAYTQRDLLIYQRGYSRSFMHVRDAVRGLILGLQSEIENVRGQIYNLGSENGNLSKDKIVEVILRRLPETTVRYKDLTFGGDMRDFHISYEKVRDKLGFDTQFTVEDGVREVLNALRSGLIDNPKDQKYRNAKFIVS